MKYRNGHFVVKDRGFFVAKTVAFILLTLYAITLIVPTIYAFFTSLKTQVEATTYNINGLPEQWLFSNYIEAFRLLNVRGKNKIEIGADGIPDFPV